MFGEVQRHSYLCDAYTTIHSIPHIHFAHEHKRKHWETGRHTNTCIVHHTDTMSWTKAKQKKNEHIQTTTTADDDVDSGADVLCCVYVASKQNSFSFVWTLMRIIPCQHRVVVRSFSGHSDTHILRILRTKQTASNKHWIICVIKWKKTNFFCINSVHLMCTLHFEHFHDTEKLGRKSDNERIIAVLEEKKLVEKENNTKFNIHCVSCL